MKPDEKILKRFGELIEMGHQVKNSVKQFNGVISGYTYSKELAAKWFTSIQSLFVNVFGLESEHYRNFLIYTENITKSNKNIK